VRNKFGGLDGFSFGLNGFRIAAKIDNRSFPSFYGPYIINRRRMFRGLAGTPEFSRVADIAVTDMLGKGIAPPGISA